MLHDSSFSFSCSARLAHQGEFLHKKQRTVTVLSLLPALFWTAKGTHLRMCALRLTIPRSFQSNPARKALSIMICAVSQYCRAGLTHTCISPGPSVKTERMRAQKDDHRTTRTRRLR